MNNKSFHIQFDPSTAIQVREAKANAYGFDLTDENLIGYSIGNLKFTVMGFRPTAQFDRLTVTVKVNLIPHVQDEYVFRQTMNLYDHDRVNTFSRSAAFNLKVNDAEVKKGIYSLCERLERYRFDELKNAGKKEKEAPLSKKDMDEAKDILKTDNLMDCIEGLLKQAGVVTEHENGLRLFLILLSRHFDKPLHALLQGSPQLSRMLMETITSSIPGSEIHEQTSMSASSLYYSRDKEYWKNRVLFLSSIDKNFKGASTIKEFIENTVLKRQTTENDYLTRQLYSANKIVPGPICLLGYSDDETLNSRFFQECFFIRLEENEKNRAEMLNHIKKESGGFVDTLVQEQAKRMLKEIQHQIEPKKVVIPYSMELELPERVFQPLRSLAQLHTFIKTIALLHQHQLKSKRDSNGVEYIEATVEHLEIALELFKGILLVQCDNLSPRERSFIERLKTHLKDKDKSFKISEVMDVLQMKRSFFYKEFNQMKELGIIVKSGGDKMRGIEYKITQWDDYAQMIEQVSMVTEQIKKIKANVDSVDSTRFPRGFHKDSTKRKRG